MNNAAFRESRQLLTEDNGSRRGERSFELTLPGLAKGLEASGRRFQERITIQSISSQVAYFSTFADLNIGSRVTLSLEIPRTLMLEKQLLLAVSGSVSRVEQEKNSIGFKRVKLLLERRFRLQPVD